MSERKVFTYKDLEEAKKYIGKKGQFDDSLMGIECNNNTVPGTLKRIAELDYHFVRDDGVAWQFFSPDPEPIEKWVPFTEEDFSVIHLKAVRFSDWTKKGFSTVLGWDGCSFEMSGDYRATPAALLSDWTFLDGTPCGKKVTE